MSVISPFGSTLNAADEGANQSFVKEEPYVAPVPVASMAEMNVSSMETAVMAAEKVDPGYAKMLIAQIQSELAKLGKQPSGTLSAMLAQNPESLSPDMLKTLVSDLQKEEQALGAQVIAETTTEGVAAAAEAVYLSEGMQSGRHGAGAMMALAGLIRDRESIDNMLQDNQKASQKLSALGEGWLQAMVQGADLTMDKELIMQTPPAGMQNFTYFDHGLAAAANTQRGIAVEQGQGQQQGMGRQLRP